MKKTFFAIVLLFLCFFQVAAQTETYQGKLQQKQWSKNLESYCAGGSDYFVLELANNQSIILDLSAWNKKKIAKNLQKSIAIKGTWRSKTMDESKSDPFSQHPTTPTMCSIFVVEK